MNTKAKTAWFKNVDENSRNHIVSKILLIICILIRLSLDCIENLENGFKEKNRKKKLIYFVVHRHLNAQSVHFNSFQANYIHICDELERKCHLNFNIKSLINKWKEFECKPRKRRVDKSWKSHIRIGLGRSWFVLS